MTSAAESDVAIDRASELADSASSSAAARISETPCSSLLTVPEVFPVFRPSLLTAGDASPILRSQGTSRLSENP